MVCTKMDIMTSKVEFIYPVNKSPSHETLLGMVDWAKVNCPGYITCDGDFLHHPVGVRYSFYFNDDKDATLFKLKWL